ncbi:MAG: amino acid adenylation domain-containing protein, partial [Lachnospiraceae bacterium]|nr:amino acid adenylation domain-containing protein [Lachnospiraceae bacterium]
KNIMKQALCLLSQKLSVLRTMIIYEKVKAPCQVVLKERELEFEYIDCSSLDEKIFMQKLKETVKSDLDRGFNLQSDTLLRLNCIKKAEKDSIFIFTIHHVIIDGWCTSIIFDEFFTFTERLRHGELFDDILNEIKNERLFKPDYGDYIKWLIKQDKLKAQKYWAEQLEGYDNTANIIPTLKPEPTDLNVKELISAVSDDTTAILYKIATDEEITINSIAELAVGILLQKYSNSNDVVFGKVISGRNAPISGIENIVGLFINTIPLRINADKNTTVSELIKQQKKCGTESTTYDFFPLADIQKSTVQGSDLIKILFVFENYGSGNKRENTDNDVSVLNVREQTNYGITISGFESEGKLCFKFMYDPNRYCEDEVKMILGRLVKICEEIANKPDAKVCELETVTEAEKHLILNDFNATETEYPRDKTVVELFEEQVKKTPDNIALAFEDNKLTYAELNEKANSLAHKLRELGVKPDDFVAIIADRSIEMIVGIYGIIKSGGAYVPIDPTYPEDRISFIIEDCVPKAILKYTTESIELSTEVPVIDLSESEVWEGVSENPEVVNKPEDAVYCIYTSGTTGKPKGVPNVHRGLVNLVSWMQSKYQLTENDVILQKTTYVFDVSASEIFWWFNAGASLAMLKKGAEKEPEVIAEEIEKYGATVIDFVPSMLSVFMSLPGEYIEKIKGLRYVLAAGEALNANLVKEFYAVMKKHGSKALLGNIYGPTEAAVYSTYYDLDLEFGGETVLIGKPVANDKAYILNGDILCGIGVPGELCISGDGLARGYLNRPELTAEKFVKNPFGEGRMYRTGDLARWLPDGNIEYLGRIDEQVKIRGFRIELGEIESRIREIENIKDCAVIARADSTGDKAIYAYYTSDVEVSVSEIRDRLSESLPEYMV